MSKQMHDAQIILGSVIDESLGDDVQVTIIATGFEEAQMQPAEEIKVKATILDVGAACELKQETHVASSQAPTQEKQPISAILSGYKKPAPAEMPVRELLVGDDALDVPAFMRKSEKSELEN